MTAKYHKIQAVDAQALEAIVRQAGELLLTYYEQSELLTYEKSPSNLVTKADLACEQFLITELQKLLPGVALWAEESGRSGDSDYCWVIDPLDGTNNFARHIGYFCISVALTYQGTPIQAAVYQPLLKEFFYAKLHEGSFLNGMPIVVRNVQSTGVMISYAYPEVSYYKDMLEKIPPSYSFRHFGACALDMAYVACGRLDAMMCQGLCWWDIAAGVLLVQEAGGIVVDVQEKLVSSESDSCSASSRALYQFLKPLFKS